MEDSTKDVVFLRDPLTYVESGTPREIVKFLKSNTPEENKNLAVWSSRTQELYTTDLYVKWLEREEERDQYQKVLGLVGKATYQGADVLAITEEIMKVFRKVES